MIFISFMICICLGCNIFAMPPLDNSHSVQKQNNPPTRLISHLPKLPQGQVKAFKPLTIPTVIQKKNRNGKVFVSQTNEKTLSPQHPVGYELFLKSKTHHYSSSGNLMEKDNHSGTTADGEMSSDEDEDFMEQPLKQNLSMPAISPNSKPLEFVSPNNPKSVIFEATKWLQEHQKNGECENSIFRNNDPVDENWYFVPTLSTIYEI